jgi:hypothetical protein
MKCPAAVYAATRIVKNCTSAKSARSRAVRHGVASCANRLNCVTVRPGFADTEVAAYVHGILPRPWNGRCDVRAIEIALEGVRLRGGATDVDRRVREALGGLGIPMH